MQPDKWQKIKWRLEESFREVEFFKADLPPPAKGEMETALFVGPLGKMKLEYTTRPVILDKKTHGSRRIGSVTEVEYVYSDTEFSHQFKAYQWNEAQNGWVPVDAENAFL